MNTNKVKTCSSGIQRDLAGHENGARHGFAQDEERLIFADERPDALFGTGKPSLYYEALKAASAATLDNHFRHIGIK